MSVSLDLDLPKGSVSIEQLIARSTGRKIAEEFPTISAFVFPDRVLYDRSATTSGKEVQAQTDDLPTITRGPACLINLAPELLCKTFDNLPMTDRISFASTNKFVAKIAVEFAFFEVNACMTPILPDLPSLPIEVFVQVAVDTRFFYLPSTPSYEWLSWSICSQCHNWIMPPIGTMYWYEHLSAELKQLDIQCTKGLLQEVAYEMVKSLAQFEHEQTGSIHNAGSVRAAEHWFELQMSQIGALGAPPT